MSEYVIGGTAQTAVDPAWLPAARDEGGAGDTGSAASLLTCGFKGPGCVTLAP